MELCRPLCKFSARPSSIEAIPYVIYQAFKKASYGRPGPSYVDLPGDILRGSIDSIPIYPALVVSIAFYFLCISFDVFIFANLLIKLLACAFLFPSNKGK